MVQKNLGGEREMNWGGEREKKISIFIYVSECLPFLRRKQGANPPPPSLQNLIFFPPYLCWGVTHIKGFKQK